MSGEEFNSRYKEILNEVADDAKKFNNRYKDILNEIADPKNNVIEIKSDSLDITPYFTCDLAVGGDNKMTNQKAIECISKLISCKEYAGAKQCNNNCPNCEFSVGEIDTIKAYTLAVLALCNMENAE